MPLANRLNPDHFRETPAARVDRPERGEAAWEQAYSELARQLADTGLDGTLYVVCGLHGSGDSTRVHRNATSVGPNAVFFDEALPSRKHRARALSFAAATGTPEVAVWVDVPIELALQRNAG